MSHHTETSKAPKRRVFRATRPYLAKHYKTVAVRFRLIFQFTYVQYCTFIAGSATFSARSTSNNDVVYTATVTDAESDPITMSIITVPAGGPFDVNNGKYECHSESSENAYISETV